MKAPSRMAFASLLLIAMVAFGLPGTAFAQFSVTAISSSLNECNKSFLFEPYLPCL
jgi:hypothetical protein